MSYPSAGMPIAHRTSDLQQLPFHWSTRGDPAVIQEVNGYSNEAHAIIKYFKKCMPRDTEVTGISRIENRVKFNINIINKI